MPHSFIRPIGLALALLYAAGLIRSQQPDVKHTVVNSEKLIMQGSPDYYPCTRYKGVFDKKRNRCIFKDFIIFYDPSVRVTSVRRMGIDGHIQVVVSLDYAPDKPAVWAK